MIQTTWICSQNILLSTYGEQSRTWTLQSCLCFSAFLLLRGARLLDSFAESLIDSLNNLPTLSLYFKSNLNWTKQTTYTHNKREDCANIYLDACRIHFYAKYLITIMVWKLTIRMNASCGLGQGPGRSVLFQPLTLQFLHHREIRGSQERIWVSWEGVPFTNWYGTISIIQ